MNVETKNKHGAKPLGILAIFLMLVTVFLFLEGLSNAPNTYLKENISIPAISYAFASIFTGILAKICWTKTTKR
jgi:hypothetical protein